MTARPALRALLLAATAWTVSAALSDALAQGKLDARYTATLAGVPVGRGAWVIDVADDQYTAAASGMTTGILSVFASGQGSSASRGRVKNGNLLPGSYASKLSTDRKTEEMRITLVNGVVKEVGIEPMSPPSPERIPVTDAHRRGVTDPMTGVLVRVNGTADPLSPEACNRSVPIFDGRMRFDLKLSFKRMAEVRAEKGYQGPAVVCAVLFSPVSGYIPDRPAIKYLLKLRDMEVWLTPLAGTRVLVPFRFEVPTPFGLGVLQATQFVSIPLPPRATPTSAKTQ